MAWDKHMPVLRGHSSGTSLGSVDYNKYIIMQVIGFKYESGGEQAEQQ